jgi:branched-chain amino acid aminotransferase
MDRATSDIEGTAMGRTSPEVKPPFSEDLKIWMDGDIVPWAEATVHVMAHVLHYGSSVFEGIRCYETPQGPAIFRLPEHTKRLLDSARIYNMYPQYSADVLMQAMCELVRVNGLQSCYLRPLVYRGLGTPGVNPVGSPVCTSIVCWDWGNYLGDHSVDQGVEVCVSSWTRFAPNTIPAMAKSSANYMNGQLIKMEAVNNGYAEGIAVDTRGFLSEGSGENLFVVRNDIVYTPPLSASVLPGITRDAVIRLLREDGIQVQEEDMLREMLYIADELFFTGTATEVAPIRSVDRRMVGDGEIGPITRRVQERFMEIVQGKVADTHGWLTRV